MRPQTEITLLGIEPGAKEGPTEDESGSRVSNSIKETEEEMLHIRNHRNLNDNQPNVLLVGNNWKLAQMGDTNHFSISARSTTGQSGQAQTPMIWRNDGTAHPGPRTIFNAWNKSPTYSSRPPAFGDRTLEIDHWRIREVDTMHLSITHIDGNVARIFRSDGKVFGNILDFSGYKVSSLGAPKCAFRTDKFVQLGGWRLGEVDTSHFSVSHYSGKTAAIYVRDGNSFEGPRSDYNNWDVEIGVVLEGTTDGCIDYVPNSMHIGNNWKLAQMGDTNHYY